jgi:hypothetical protein
MHTQVQLLQEGSYKNVKRMIRMYEKRIIDESLKSYFEAFPAILIEGAKAVGSKESCLHIAIVKFIPPCAHTPISSGK